MEGKKGERKEREKGGRKGGCDEGRRVNGRK